ncbi:MAG TPA: hypothetical protein VGC49_01760 [Solirubrobacterales bacterium]|jgi:hypothetical protein
MLTDTDVVLAAWKLPLIVAAIAVSIVAGFYLGGPGLGMAVGALAASSIVVLAVRNPPQPPIHPAPVHDSRRHLLIVVTDPLEDSPAIEQIAAAAGDGRSDPEIVVLAPLRNRFIDRWTSDSGPALDRAQRTLVVSLASLAKAGIAATARVGAEGLVQAVEDQLRSYPATAVTFVSDNPSREVVGAVRELESRLRTPFNHLVASPLQRPEARVASPITS